MRPEPASKAQAKGSRALRGAGLCGCVSVVRIVGGSLTVAKKPTQEETVKKFKFSIGKTRYTVHQPRIQKGSSDFLYFRSSYSVAPQQHGCSILSKIETGVCERV